MNIRPLIVISLSVNIMYSYSQTSPIDSLKRISIEIGKSVPWYMEDQNVRFFYTNEPKVTFAKIYLISRRNYYGISSYLHELYYPEGKISLRNDVINRLSIGGSIHYGRFFYHEKTKMNFIPQLSLGFREGYERIYIEEGYGWHHYTVINYEYLSPSIGFGFDLNRVIGRVFTVGIETQYNHFFESKKPYDNSNYKIDQIPEHKVNKNVINIAFKLGITIDWKRK